MGVAVFLLLQGTISRVPFGRRFRATVDSNLRGLPGGQRGFGLAIFAAATRRLVVVFVLVLGLQQIISYVYLRSRNYCIYPEFHFSQ